MNWLRRSNCSTRYWQYPEAMFLFVERLRQCTGHDRRRSFIISLGWNHRTSQSRSWTLGRTHHGEDIDV